MMYDFAHDDFALAANSATFRGALVEFLDGDVAELDQSRRASPIPIPVFSAVVLQADSTARGDPRQLGVLENLFAVEFHG
jgi:hypothetical protein